MLIEKVNCPYGCVNSVMLETTKRVVTGNSNLLLDSTKSESPISEIVKVFTCNCCGRSFDSHQPSSGKLVI